MKSPEQLKGLIRNFAIEKDISAQEVLQTYMFERLIERLSISQYRDNFILKGGLLISSIIGIEERTTMDMDTTIRGIAVTEKKLVSIVKDIINLDILDGINFRYSGIKSIKKIDSYNNYSVSIIANYGKIKVPLKIDITTGDTIVAKEIKYKYKLSFEDRSVIVLAYSIETILAEKLETVLSRGVLNTRSRDFYDIYSLFKIKEREIDFALLREAIIATTKNRETYK